MQTVTVADPRIIYMTINWISTASIGSIPANSRPVIAPGRAISPTTLVLSICVVIAVLIILGAKNFVTIFYRLPKKVRIQPPNDDLLFGD